MGRAEAYTHVKKYSEASEDYSQVVSIDDQKAEAYAKRGVLSYVTGEEESGDTDLQKTTALTEEYSTEEKEELYDKIETYIAIFEFLDKQEETAEEYYVTIYEFPNGSHLVFLHDETYSFSLEYFAENEEITIKPVREQSVIWVTEPSVPGKEVYDFGINFIDVYQPFGLEIAGYPFDANDRRMQLTGIDNYVAAIRTNDEVLICDYNGNIISRAPLPTSNNGQFAFQYGETWFSTDMTYKYMFLPVDTSHPGIVYRSDFSVESTDQEYYPAIDLMNDFCAYQNGRFIYIHSENFEPVISEGYYSEVYYLPDLSGIRTICHEVDSHLIPIGTVVVDENENIVSKSDYIYSGYLGLSFVNGYYSACQQSDYFDETKNFAFVDASTGRPITDFIYDNVKWFEDGYAPVKKNGMWGFIDHLGNEVTEFIFEDAGALY